ncbi:cutinase-domain-containing protein [Mollisia scopiformis]|uniref:Cutinase n=1 Tax=Mollisia scopiformis TaxID=149040 RepID=A0A194XGA8_MOLSC|nr:cutinase-domain-containing protein [Mollisia scopiformis]KUJ19203.1 cutinase-domain-containing protein [Mollisia scopiformis]
MLFPLTIIFISLPFLNAAGTDANTGDLGTSTTQNGLTNDTGCKAMTVIFARGTTEQGNVGTLSGPPFFASLAQSVGTENLAVQGVDYPADIPGFLAGGDANGSKTMAQLVTQAMTTCPNTKVVMSGYSQGGQLVHNAAKMMDASTTAKINSVLIFGDPDNGTAVGTVPASKTLVICHDGDNICQHGDQILQPHLTYSMNAGQAAQFVASAAGMAGKGNGTATKFVA